MAEGAAERAAGAVTHQGEPLHAPVLFLLSQMEITAPALRAHRGILQTPGETVKPLWKVQKAPKAYGGTGTSSRNATCVLSCLWLTDTEPKNVPGVEASGNGVTVHAIAGWE